MSNTFDAFSEAVLNYSEQLLEDDKKEKRLDAISYLARDYIWYGPGKKYALGELNWGGRVRIRRGSSNKGFLNIMDAGDKKANFLYSIHPEKNVAEYEKEVLISLAKFFKKNGFRIKMKEVSLKLTA